MHIDPATLLFEDVDDTLASDIEFVADSIMLGGEIPHPRPPWLELWLEVAGGREQELLMLSTVFPGRAYCSLYRRTKSA